MDSIENEFLLLVKSQSLYLDQKQFITQFIAWTMYRLFAEL